jgi:hypothetical protein
VLLVQESEMVLLLELTVQGLSAQMAQLRVEVEALVVPQGLYLVGKE